MTKRIDEEVLKDALLDHLRSAEGKDYKVIGEDVSNRTGTKNFDYLAQEECDGGTLAMETTLVSDNPQEFERESIRYRAEEAIRQALARQNGGFFIEVPYRFAQSKVGAKRELRSVADRISKQAAPLEPHQSADIESGLGMFRIECVSATDKFVVFHSLDPTGSWSTHDSDVTTMSGALRERLGEKNKQLDADADRKVVVFGRMAGIIERDAIAEAVRSLDGEFENIDEVYFYYGQGNVERYR
jgi:hypothetical protein